MRKHVLCIAYHFPPVRGSSGLQRTLKFATYIRDHGWEPIILTVNPRAYESTSGDQLDEIPKGMLLKRSFAIDSARHLSLRGKYPNWLAIPDRYWSWLLCGFWNGRAMIRRHRAVAIWSTFPVATAHILGALLQKSTHLPWIADFRDSMTEESYPVDPFRRRVYRRIERYTVQHAHKCVFTTSGTRQMYAARYPFVPRDRWEVIPNGFDEENFEDAEGSLAPPPLSGRPLLLVHSGTLYPSERDPTQFFEAIARLKVAGTIDAKRLRVILRATGHDEFYRRKLAASGIDDIVILEPAIPYRAALAEMLAADGLLLLQASNSNHQVPAKLYEYLRAGRPIFALTDPAGDTAEELRAAGSSPIVPLDDANAIANGLSQFLIDIESGRQSGTSREQSRAYSRRNGAETLAKLLDMATQFFLICWSGARLDFDISTHPHQDFRKNPGGKIELALWYSG